MRLFRAVLAASLAALAACGSDKATAPKPVATSVEVTASTATTTPAGVALAAAPTFVVKDQFGHPMAGVPVTVAVTAGGGTIANAPTASAAAPASVGTWTLGRVAGSNTLTVTVANLAPATLTIAGAIGAPARVMVLGGNGQTALAGTTLPQGIRIAVLDQFDNAVPNQTINLAVAAGSGTLQSQTVTSGADGAATVPAWTLGRSAVPQQLRATSGTLSAVIDATVQTSYTIDVRFFGTTPMTAAQQALFTTAAARIRGAVVGQLSTLNVTGVDPDADCGTVGVGTMSGTTDGVIIYASVDTIDGPGQILAHGGPCYVRTGGSSSATIIGVMAFDKADIASLGTGQILQDVITHEMLHVVGLGSLWNYKSLLANYNTTTVSYTGVGGLAGCQQVGGTNSCAVTVPVEGTGGAGTMNSHWRESTFKSELMTGYAENGPMPLSVMSIRSLADLGYTVNPASADPYTIFIGSIQASGARSPSPLPENWEGPTPFQPITLAVARQRAAARAAALVGK